MAIELTPAEIEQAVPSLQKYFREELEQDLSDMRARFLLDFFLKEIAPHAYNRGISDAARYFAARTEDLSGICFEAPMTYWSAKKKR